MALSSIVQPLLLGATALAVLYLIARGVYLFFFHPLARYPGPFLAKFTDLYGAYHALRGDIHLDMWRCHQRYGDYVRYGPNKLTFNTAEGLRDIYSTSAVGKIVKSDSYEPLVHRAPNTLTIRGGKEHARRRRIMSQGVSEKAQRGYEDRVVSHILELCDAVFPLTEKAGAQEQTETWSEPMDMSQWCYYLSFDIMADVVFSARYNLLTSPKFRYITQCIDRSNVRMSVLIQVPWLARLKIDKHFFPIAIEARNRFVKFVSRVVGDRLKKQTAVSALLAKNEQLAQEDDAVREIQGDVFSNLVAARDPDTGEGFALNEIAAESTTLIVAGSDTTSTAFASILFYLADNPAAYEKAAAEVRSKFSSREEIFMGPALASCNYLRACVDEALRMSPPVGLALWREIIAPNGMTLDKHHLPTGTHIGVPLYSIHHDAKYYNKPFEYNPERWLEDDGSGDSIERARSVFNPFSIGMRGCLGKGLANTEMMLTLATILFTGDFKFAGGEKGLVGRGTKDGVLGRQRTNEYQLWDHVTSQKKGPWLQFKARAL